MNYFLFIAMGGTIQGLILAGYFSKHRKATYEAGFFLASTLILLSYVSLVNILLINGDIISVPHVSFTQSAIAFLVAPSFYFFVKVSIKNPLRLGFSSLIHLLPFIIFIACAWSYFTLSAEQKIIVLTQLSIGEGNLSRIPFNKDIFYLALIVQLLIYLAAMIQCWFNFKNKNQLTSPNVISISIGFYTALTLFLALRYCFFYSYDSSILLPILLSSGFYGLSIWAIWSKKPLLSIHEIKSKYQHSSLSDWKMKEMVEKMMDKLIMDQLILQKNLNLGILANSLNTSPHVLSQSINSQLNETYNDLINRLRVQMVIKRLNSNHQRHLSIEGIALESGFKSKSSFYRAFKKHTGSTPSNYLNNIN